MVMGPSPGPAPAVHALARICSVSRSSWRVAEGERAQERADRGGARTRWPAPGWWTRSAARRRHRCSPTGQDAVGQGQQLGAGVGCAGPLAEVDELVGGLLDAEPFGQGGGWQQVRAGDGVGVVEADVELVQGVGGWHRESALLIGNTAAVAGAILPGQRAFLIIGS